MKKPSAHFPRGHLEMTSANRSAVLQPTCRRYGEDIVQMRFQVRCGYVAGWESPHCSSRLGVAPADVLTELSGRFLSHRSMDSMELDPKAQNHFRTTVGSANQRSARPLQVGLYLFLEWIMRSVAFSCLFRS